MKLSPKLREFSNFIERYTAENSFSPTHSEIAKGLGFKSMGTVHWYIKKLKEKGIIQDYDSNSKRALTLNTTTAHKFTKAEVSSVRAIPLFDSVSAGFPSPAEDYIKEYLDLNKHLIKNPASTFFVEARGDSMNKIGIFNKDLLIVDRSLEVANNSVVIAVVYGECLVKSLVKMKGELYLMPQNINYEPIKISEHMDFEIWGKVITAIHMFS